MEFFKNRKKYCTTEKIQKNTKDTKNTKTQNIQKTQKKNHKNHEKHKKKKHCTRRENEGVRTAPFSF